MKNYIKLQNSLFHCNYFFIDVPEYFADNLFINHKIPVKFNKEYKRNKTKFIIINVKFKKKYEEEFLKCMKELHNKMLLLGNSDYDEFCKWLIDTFYKE